MQQKNSRHPELVSGSSRSMKGFTLIELLVVILIIGLLAAVALPQYQKAVEKGRASEAIVLLDTLYKGQTLYHLEHGYFTDDLKELSITLQEEE